MLNSQAVDLTSNALWLVLFLSAPPIIAASIVGLIVAIVQTATQLQEQTLQYTLKFFAIVIVIFLMAPLLGGALYQYADRVFTNFPAIVGR
jgi:type III secretion protein S